MGSAADFILDGLAEYLELERELGTRTIAIDRSLLVNVARASSPRTDGDNHISAPGRGRPGYDASPASRNDASSKNVAGAQGGDALPTTRRVSVAGASSPRTDNGIAFLHHAALTPPATEMMAKIIGAMKLTAETAPIVFTGPMPSSRILVVLGGLALKKWFPATQKGAPGQWLRLDDGREVLVTYTPEYLLRFKAMTPAVEQMKRNMWSSLKTVMHKLKATQQ